MKSLLHFSVILFLFIIGVSCSTSDDNILASDTLIFTASLNGTNEVPKNASTAKGTTYLIYSKTTKIFTINIAYSGLVPTMALIQKSAINIPDQIVFTAGDFSDYSGFYNEQTNASSNIHFTSPALTAEQEADLLANRYYVNLYSNAYPKGDIRGQLIKANPDNGDY